VSERRAPDTYGLADAATTFPERLPDVLGAARRALAGFAPSDIRAVAACGVGTGGLAAEAAAALSAPRLTVPFWVGHAAEVPAFVGPHTLFFALSASGTSEETVAAAAEAAARGAIVVAVGGDPQGTLAHLAEEAALAWCPRGETGARTVEALAATLVPVLVALAAAGLAPDAAARLDEAAASLARRRNVFVGPDGQAAQVARRIGRTIPLVYGAEGVDAAAARWWKARVNLNVKAPAFAGAVPARTYDELAGWGQGGDITRQVVSLVLLRRDGEPLALARLFEAVMAECDEVMADMIEVRAEDDDDLGRFFELALLGELVSLALAGHEGVDPGPVPGIDEAHPR